MKKKSKILGKKKDLSCSGMELDQRPDAAEKITCPTHQDVLQPPLSQFPLEEARRDNWGKEELLDELRSLLSVAKSRENVSSTLSILKLIREIEQMDKNENKSVGWLGELIGMSDEELEFRVKQEMAALGFT